MFTGIIEQLGRVEAIRTEGSNRHFTLSAPLAAELQIDQSLAHDGVCLTVVDQEADRYTVTAVAETLARSTLGDWTVGTPVNLERAMRANARLDGHLVQGHVDGTAICTEVLDRDGSWSFHFRYIPSPEHLLVDKGSICINGVSLTVVSPHDDVFEVAIIPYTYTHTTFAELRVGQRVNLEFDVVGKYIARYAALYGLEKGAPRP